MPKHGFLTPKAIANRIKAKGLQKLRWYCQMCQKQCRDENGFKCHTTSESHQRQLLLFAESPHKYIDSFSKEFLDEFMLLLRRRFGTKRVHANQVYQEYIADRNHLHMNATRWVTLTGFVKWLGRKSLCIVDETEKGWFITYIDRQPETIHRQKQLEKREKMKLDDEERMAKLFKQQMERDRQKGLPSEPVFTELKKESEEEKVVFSLKTFNKKPLPAVNMKENPLASAEKSKQLPQKRKAKETDAEKKQKMALDEIIEQDEKRREKFNRKDNWLAPGIVVKIITKSLGNDYFKKKAVVREVKNLYTGRIKLLDTGQKFDVDQADLETVVPAVGRKVLVLNGAYRGSEGQLVAVNFEKFSVKIEITSGSYKGRVIDHIKYEDISKVHIQS